MREKETMQVKFHTEQNIKNTGAALDRNTVLVDLFPTETECQPDFQGERDSTLCSKEGEL